MDFRINSKNVSFDHLTGFFESFVNFVKYLWNWLNTCNIQFNKMKDGIFKLLLLFIISIYPGCGSKGPERVVQTRSFKIANFSTEEISLRSYAQKCSLDIGTAVLDKPLMDDSLYARTLAREFSMITPGDVMKFGTVHSKPDIYDFSKADTIVKFAEANGMKIRGHTLVWHYHLPHWLEKGNWSREELIEILREHIFEVVGHYKGQVEAWDVVNEAVSSNGSLRKSIWFRVIGPEYIDMAFRWAHEADPKALLFYNDHSSEILKRKSDAIYKLVRDLKSRGVPIDGVGLQMHIQLTKPPKPQDVAVIIERLSNLGLEVHITEMDVRIKKPFTDEKLKSQAQIYHDILEVCLAHPNCKAFVMWGFTDRYSWIPHFYSGTGGALIFDESYNPKPSYNALVDAFLGR